MDSLRVLVLDDHEPNRFLLVIQLASFGHIVFEARSGIEALGLLLSNDYDVLFTDLNMPGMDGHELVRELRAFEASQRTPRCFVVGVTAKAREEAREDCLLSGMDNCLFKPVRVKDLDICLSSMKAGIVSNLPADRVSLNYIVDLFDGDLNLSGKLFLELRENNTRDLHRLEEIIISGSISELRSLIHHIMNGARMVGDVDLVQSILYFEDVGRFGKLDIRYSRSLQSIRTHLIFLQSSLSTWRINNNI